MATIHQQMARLQTITIPTVLQLEQAGEFEAHRSKLQLHFSISFNSFYLDFHGGKLSSGRLNKKYYYIFSRTNFVSSFSSLETI